MSTQFEVTVLSRFHNIGKLKDLDRALFSLFCQNEVTIHSKILCQHLSADDFQEVQDTCNRYKRLNFDISCTNEIFDEKGDHRAELLNRGISYVETQYMAFLDSDDIVYPSCYIRLLRRLNKTSAAIAFTGVNRADQFSANGYPFTLKKFRIFNNLPKLHFFIANQYPIHSYVIDLFRVDRSLLYFDKGMSRNEDYAFLYRLLSRHVIDDYECSRSNCEYTVDMGGSNTILAYRRDKESIKGWSVAEAYMTTLKEKSPINATFQELQDLKNYFEERVTDHNTSEPEIINSEGVTLDCENLTNAVFQSLKRDERENLLDGACVIEKFDKLEDGRFSVFGWCAGGRNCPLVGIFIDESGSLTEISNFYERDDVKNYFKSDNNRFGFAVIVNESRPKTIRFFAEDGHVYEACPSFISN